MITIHLRPLLAAVLCWALANSLFAQPAGSGSDRIHGAEHDHAEIEEVIVTATPLARDVIEISQSATVLSGAALEREVAGNIGDTLGRLPGITNASFGHNVGRPVIRGMQGSRVGVLSNNMSSSDASAVSQDHAVPVEPFLADQIEVLRGPATLLYGSGSIGGVVNIVSHTIPQEVPEEGMAGRALVQGDNAADQRLAAARFDAGSGSWAFHANGFYRRTDDYEIPGLAELYPEEEHEHEAEEPGEVAGILENSFLDNEGGSLGAAWIGSRWRLGLAWTGYESNYGIPGGHGHEEDEDHGDEDHDDGDHEDEDHEEEHGEEPVTIDLSSSRFDGELTGEQPMAGVEQVKLRFAKTDYEHTEFEGEEVGTIFTTDTLDARLELRHATLRRMSGAFGFQYSDRDFSAVGEEAFVPPTESTNLAIFLVESFDLERWQVDLGARYEDVDVERLEAVAELPGPLDRNFNPFTLSGGLIWHLTEGSHFTFNLSRAERAPADQELFAFGPHVASQTFEIGDPGLGTETNLHLEAGYRLHLGRLTGSLVIYTDDFDDYIYQADTGEEEDGFPVRHWSQQDADFTGGEIEFRYDLGDFATGHWQLTGFADRIRAELSDGSRVPRMPPSRFGLGVEWDHLAWAASANWIQASSQDRVAEFETRTPGYDLLNAEVSWLLPFSERLDWAVYLRGQNLLDEDIRNSTSYLKDQAPQIGRNFVLGLRAVF